MCVFTTDLLLIRNCTLYIFNLSSLLSKLWFPVCLCNTYGMPGTCDFQKRVSAHLELEPNMVLNTYMCTEN